MARRARGTDVWAVLGEGMGRVRTVKVGERGRTGARAVHGESAGRRGQCAR